MKYAHETTLQILKDLHPLWDTSGKEIQQETIGRWILLSYLEGKGVHSFAILGWPEAFPTHTNKAQKVVKSVVKGMIPTLQSL